ncbi:hypothetical protein AA313_de0209178 [Arthrobotrys entomopaga]|nr:hypothetical protein AA313_de0209178 [Arthrobotrys entomopaga]
MENGNAVSLPSPPQKQRSTAEKDSTEILNRTPANVNGKVAERDLSNSLVKRAHDLDSIWGGGNEWFVECDDYQNALESHLELPALDQMPSVLSGGQARYERARERCTSQCTCVPAGTATEFIAALFCSASDGGQLRDYASSAFGRKCKETLQCHCVARVWLKEPQSGGQGSGSGDGPWGPPRQLQGGPGFQGPGGSFGWDGTRIKSEDGTYYGGGSGRTGYQHRQLAPGTKEPYWLYGPESFIQPHFLSALAGFAGSRGFNSLRKGISKRSSVEALAQPAADRLLDRHENNISPAGLLLGYNGNAKCDTKKPGSLAIFNCQYQHQSPLEEANKEYIIQLIENECFPYCSANRGDISNFFILCELDKYGSDLVYIHPRCQNIDCRWIENLGASAFHSESDMLGALAPGFKAKEGKREA